MPTVTEDVAGVLADLDARVNAINRRLLLDPVFENANLVERITEIDDYFDETFDDFFDEIRVGEGRVTSGMIATRAIAGYHMIVGAVDAAILAAGAVGTEHIQAAAIGAAQIQIAAVDTAAIRNAAIVRALVADAAIGTAQIDDLAVTNAKILEIEAAKITAGVMTATISMTAAQLIGGAIVGGTIAIGTSSGDPDNPNPTFTVNGAGSVVAQQISVDGITMFERQRRLDLEAAYSTAYSVRGYGIQIPGGDGNLMFIAGGSRIAGGEPYSGRVAIGDPTGANYLIIDDIGISRGDNGLPSDGTLFMMRTGGEHRIGAPGVTTTLSTVYGRRANSAIMRVYNDAPVNTDSPRGIDIELGNGSVNPGTDDRYMRFLRGDGALVDTIQGDGAGGARFSGTASGTYSDTRLKANRRPLEALELWPLVPWETFDWDHAGLDHDGDRGHGPAAQSMMLAHPDLAAMVSHPENPDGYMRVDKAQLVPVLAAKILELDQRLTDAGH